MYMLVRCPRRIEEGGGSPIAEVAGGCELPDMGALSRLSGL